MKRLYSILLILCLLPGILSGALTGSSAKQSAAAAAAASKSGILSIADPTQDEIRAAYAQYRKPTRRFAVAPSVNAPYATGVVDANYLEQARNYLNLYRMVAKVQTLEADADKNSLAQYGAVLLGVLNKAVHYPADSEKPADMDAAFFQKGRDAVSRSTISSFSFREYVQTYGWEQTNLYKIQEMIPYVLMFQIRDYDKGNFQCLGHRRYLLSPYVQSYGYGVADSADEYSLYFVVTHSTKAWPADELLQDPDFDYIAWPPSGNCPRQLMEKTFPWSISLNEDRYLVPAVKDSSGSETEVGDRSGVVIKVTRESDGRVWTFDQNSPDGSAISDPRSYNKPYFYIDKRSRGFGPVRDRWLTETMLERYFASNAIIFRPDFEDQTPFNGLYTVRVTGLKKIDGSAAELNYQVNFFDITPCEHAWSDWTVTQAASCTEGGVRARVCSKCNTTETQETVALGHAWSAWLESSAPDCEHGGEELRSCSRCGLTETRSLPALGHDWDAGTVTKEPSCTEDGAKEAQCLRCGAVEQSVTVPALGHDWDAGVVVKEPSYQEDGEKLYSCGRCGETKTEPIPRLPNPFEDVEEGKYYYKPVLWAFYHDPQITSGTSSTLFGVKAPCTREQIVTFLWKACGAEEPTLSENPFTDVKAGKYYYKAVMWAREKGVTGGVSETSFGVGQTCTREQAMTFLWTAMKKPAPQSSVSPFTDVTPGKYYFKPVLWAVEQGVTSGVSSTLFGVGEPCTRGQIVTFLYKALGQ